MQLSAEIRWFWKENAPPKLDLWFRGQEHHPYRAGGGGPEPRRDRYLRDSQPEMGIKLRGKNPGVEVKGLIARGTGKLTEGWFSGDLELWCKWISSSLNLAEDQTVTVEKWRELRKFDTRGTNPVEVELGSDERPLVEMDLPRGCNVELTKIRLPALGQTWWTLGFESFGTLSTVEADLRAVAKVLNERDPPSLEGGNLASYPVWLIERQR